MSKICGIYRITSPSNKIYIGQSVDIKRRFRQYREANRNKKHPKLNASFLKYGIEAHIFEIIEECDILLLNERERYWQEYYDVLNKGLNLALVDTLSARYTHSEESKKKISQNNKGKKKKPHSDQFKENMSIARKGDKNPFFGKTHTNETMTRILKNRKKNRKTSHKMLINTDNDVIFSSIKSAWELNYKYSMKFSTFKAMINGQNPNKTPFVYYSG